MAKKSKGKAISDAEDVVRATRMVFQEAQATVATHRRLVLQLSEVLQSALELDLHVEFNSIFCRMIGMILNKRKNYKPADRIVNFISTFIEYLSSNDSTQEIYTEFINDVFQYMMQGMEARNAIVRYRVCHVISHIVHHLLEEHLEPLRDKLAVRVYDVNVEVRVKAVIAYSAFQNEDGAELSEAGRKLEFIMQNDEKSEMRKQCLLRLEKNEKTEPLIVGRARDKDKSIRKTLYSKVLPSYDSIWSISAGNRVRLLQWGLRDRDDEVREACKSWLIDTWLKDCENDLFKVLEAIDILKTDIGQVVIRTIFDSKPEFVSSTEFSDKFFNDLSIPTSLLARVYFEYCRDENRTDLIEINFPTASVYSDIIKKYVDLRYENMKLLNETLSKNEVEKHLNVEEDGIVDPDEYEYINLQLMKIAIDYDYSDEFGRSKLYNNFRNMLANMNNHLFSNELLEALTECLRKLAVNERDFCQIIVEIIYDIKDTMVESLKEEEEEEKEKQLHQKKRTRSEDSDSDSDDESGYQSAVTDISKQSIIETNKSRMEEISQISKLPAEALELLLKISKYMLRLVFSPLGDNIPVISLHNNFILPCLNDRTEVEIRILALQCHGLCGLLDREVAIGVMVVAAIFVSKSEHQKLIEVGVKVMCDLLATHGISIVQGDREKSIDTMAVARVFYRTIKDDRVPEAQAVVAEGLFKLFLCNVIDDEELLEMTILKFFDPMILKNDKLRQCLEFCIPTYCFARESHQALLTKIVEDTVRRLFRDWENIMHLNNKSWVYRPTTVKFIIEKLSEWSCPWNLALLTEDEMKRSSNHLEFGLALLKLLRDFDASKASEKRLYKPILLHLSQLVLTPEIGSEKLLELREQLGDPRLFRGDLALALQDKTCASSFARIVEFVEACVAKARELEGSPKAVGTSEAEEKEQEEKCRMNGIDDVGGEKTITVDGEQNNSSLKPLERKSDSCHNKPVANNRPKKKISKKNTKQPKSPSIDPDDSGYIVIDSD